MCASASGKLTAWLWKTRWSSGAPEAHAKERGGGWRALPARADWRRRAALSAPPKARGNSPPEVGRPRLDVLSPHPAFRRYRCGPNRRRVLWDEISSLFAVHAVTEAGADRADRQSPRYPRSRVEAIRGRAESQRFADVAGSSPEPARANSLDRVCDRRAHSPEPHSHRAHRTHAHRFCAQWRRGGADGP